MPWSLLTSKWMLAAFTVAALGAALTLQTARLKAAQRAEAAAEQVTRQWRANFEAMAETNAANVAALEKLRAEAARIEAAAAAARRANTELAAAIEVLRRRIAHAVPDQDGTVRPVLCATVNELRRLGGGAGPACGD